MNQEISKKVVSLFFSKTKKELRKELKLSQKELQKYIDLNGLKKVFFVTEEEKVKAKELALEGKTLDYIAKELGYSVVCIFYHLKSQGINAQELRVKKKIKVMKKDTLSDSQKAKKLKISIQNYYHTKKRLQKKGLI